MDSLKNPILKLFKKEIPRHDRKITRTEIEHIVRRKMSRFFGLPYDKLKPNAKLEKDLGIGETGIAEIFLVVLPDVFEIDFSMPEKENTHTIDDIVDHVAKKLRIENRFFDARTD